MLPRLSRLALAAPSILLAQAKPKPSPIPTLAEVNAKAVAVAGVPEHRIALTEVRRISGSSTGLFSVNAMEAGPRGQIAVAFTGSVKGQQNPYQTLALFDSTGRRLWTINNGRDAEIGWFSSFGWWTNDFWVYDQRFNQIALIDHGSVTKSLEIPTWIRPGWSERKNYPVFGAIDISAVLEDGSLVGRPYRAHSAVAGGAFDSTKFVIVRTSPDGVIERTLLSIPDRDAEWQQQYSDFRRRQPEGQFPPANSPLLSREWPIGTVSWDGNHVALVSMDSSHGAVDTVSVTMRDGKGTQVYTRRFEFPRKWFSQAEIDSMAKVRFSRSPEGVRAQRAATMARVIRDAEHVVVGGDGSVWITLRQTNATWPVVGIDASGQFIGTMYLPSTYSLRAADRGGVWLIDGRPVIKDLVRYTYR